MQTFKSLKSWLVATALLVGLSTPAAAAEGPAGVALTEVKEGVGPKNAVQNRFFLKKGRIEATPILGYVPNDPMVKRFVGGLLGAYHFSEEFAAEGAFIYSPDLGQTDLKGLTTTLVGIPVLEGQEGFQQPVEKMIMGATFAARWAPFYGKINVIGESVLNFDAYGVLGLGMLSMQSYYVEGEKDGKGGVATSMVGDGKDVHLTPNVGFGFNFFLNQTIALKLEARSYFYIDDEPNYGATTTVDSKRLYNNLVASVGLSFFIPEMKKRMYNF